MSGYTHNTTQENVTYNDDNYHRIYNLNSQNLETDEQKLKIIIIVSKKLLNLGFHVKNTPHQLI